jgi:hypothetical protein
MRKIILPLVFAGILLAAMFGLIQRVQGQGPTGPDGMQVLQNERQGDNVREIIAPPGPDSVTAPNLGFIDSPTASCYQPDATKDICFINWYYLSVNADPNYMITMTITLNDIGVVANYHGFFQTSMYAPYNMRDRGFQVACGALGSGGNSTQGMGYGYTIRARDSASLSSANYGTIYCPAFIP